MTIVTVEDRFKAALTDIRLNSDVQVFDNYPSCCGSCAGYDLEQEFPDGNYVYFINQQNHGITWQDGMPWNFEDPDDMRPETPAKVIYFNHSNQHSATVLRDTLSKFGLPVEWDGTEMKCVVLRFA